MTIADQLETRKTALTATELVDILNISRLTVYDRAKAGQIPCFRIGTCVRFDPKRTAEYLRQIEIPGSVKKRI